MANRGRVIYGLRDYKAFYKDVFVRAAICEVGPNFSYDPLAGISRKEFGGVKFTLRDSLCVGYDEGYAGL